MMRHKGQVLEVSPEGQMFPIKGLPLPYQELRVPIYKKDLEGNVTTWPAQRCNTAMSRIRNQFKWYSGEVDEFVNTEIPPTEFLSVVDRYLATLFANYEGDLDLFKLRNIGRDCLVTGKALIVNIDNVLYVPDIREARPLNNDAGWTSAYGFRSEESDTIDRAKLWVIEGNVFIEKTYRATKVGTVLRLDLTREFGPTVRKNCQWAEINHGDVYEGWGTSLIQETLPLILKMIRLNQQIDYVINDNVNPIRTFTGSDADFTKWLRANQVVSSNVSSPTQEDIDNFGRARYNSLIKMTDGTSKIDVVEYGGQTLRSAFERRRLLNQEFTFLTGITMLEAGDTTSEVMPAAGQARHNVNFTNKVRLLHREIRQKLQSIGFDLDDFEDMVEAITNAGVNENVNRSSGNVGESSTNGNGQNSQ